MALDWAVDGSDDRAMTIKLDHTIVRARDKDASARFLSEMFGLPAPTHAGPFAMVRVDDTSIDYVDEDDERFDSQHYAFLVSETEFDEIFGRIRSRGLTYWADPFRKEPGRTNDWDGGRGVYFDDPNGHLLEIITRTYGTGGTTSSKPHPLTAGRT